MKKLIVVKGISNSGKTSSIIEFMEVHRNVIVSPPPSLIAFRIHKADDWMLGVAKDGDTAENVRLALNFFKKNNCDIGVCATKSYGSSVNELNAFRSANTDVEVVFVESRWKKTPAEQAIANAIVAKEIEDNIP